MADYRDFSHAECRLVSQKCSSAILHPLDHPIEALKVFLHKLLYAGVVGVRLEAAVWEFISGRWATNWDIVDKRNGGVWDFWLEDVGNVVMEDWDRICPSHGQSDKSVGAKQCLEGGEVVGRFGESSFIVADIEVQNAAASVSCKLFSDLISIWGHT